MITVSIININIKARFTYALIIMAITLEIAFAQNMVNIDSNRIEVSHVVSIGDYVPDFVIYNVVNHEDSVLRLSDLKGKGIIIDFWATWCVPCITNFPKLQDIQNKYSEELQVVSISFQNEKVVESFFNKLPLNKKPNFIMATEKASGGKPINMHLMELFPHIGIPHYIWIGKDGVLKATTGSEEISEENIIKFLNNDRLHFNMKEAVFNTKNTEESKTYSNIKNSFFTSGSEDMFIGVKYSSTLTSILDGKAGVTTAYNTTFPGSIFENRRISVLNAPVMLLYTVAYGEAHFGKGAVPFSNVILEFSDSIKYHNFVNTNNDDSLKYCYNLIIPESTDERDVLFKMMQMDLERFFGISAKVENRKTKVYTIISRGEEIARTQESESIIEHNPYYIKIVNQPLSSLTNLLNKYNEQYKTIFIDETGLNYNVDIEFQIECMTSIREITNQINKYNFDIIEVEKSLKMLVLTDE